MRAKTKISPNIFPLFKLFSLLFQISSMKNKWKIVIEKLLYNFLNVKKSKSPNFKVQMKPSVSFSYK